MDTNVQEEGTITITHALTHNPEETVVTIVVAANGRIPADALREVLELYVSKLSALTRDSSSSAGTGSIPAADESAPICGAV